MIAVGAIIEDEKKRILLVKHKPERGGFWRGKWICPGGKLKLGEKIEDGIKREVWEETHLQVELTHPLIPFDRIVKSETKTSLHVIYIDYMAKVVGGELEVDSDVGEARWVKREELPTIWEELHDDTKRLLQIAKVV
jgi:ADP-ribose pyrophosphatase YjhB (NUDIX family)